MLEKELTPARFRSCTRAGLFSVLRAGLRHRLPSSSKRVRLDPYFEENRPKYSY